MTDLEDKDEFWSQGFKELDLSGQTISAREFDGCTFNNCNFSETTLARCNFVDCEFSNCNFSIADIQYSKFSEVVFSECKLVGINWTKVSWPSVLLASPLKFFKCVINDSSFYGLSLPELVLEECRALNVDFREGDFSNANFTYTDLAGSQFGRTNLSGADFSEASNYDIDILQNKVEGAKFSRFEATRLLEAFGIELAD